MVYKLIVQSKTNKGKKEFTHPCDTIDEAIYWIGKHVGHTIRRKNVVNIQIVKEE